MKYIVVFGAFIVSHAFAGSFVVEPPKQVAPPTGIKKLTENEKELLPALCSRKETAVIKSIKIKDNPQFYFRPLPNSDEIIYAAGGANSPDGLSHNYSLDWNSGKKTIVPGEFDGFPSPDGKLLVVAGEKLKIYDLENPKKPLFEDIDLRHGYYQSVGELNNKDEKIYRVMVDDAKGHFYFRDYKWKGAVFKNLSQVSENTPPIQLCKSLKGQLSTPMMSKDGKYVAAYNKDTQTTNVYAIDGKTGDCNETQNLGMTTGKVDFSYDGELVTYSQIAVRSVLGASSDPVMWMRWPKDDMVANVYVRNLKTGETKALTHYHDTSILYPAFNAKNEIIARKYDAEGAEFIKLNPYTERESIELKPSERCLWSKDFLKIFALGETFLSYCATNAKEWNAESIALLGKDLDKKQCQALANWWSKFDSDTDLSFLEMNEDSAKKATQGLKEISSSDLLAACGM